MSTRISFEKSSGKYSCEIDGNTFKTSKKDYIEFMYKKITGAKKSYDEIVGAIEPGVSTKFEINTRFAFVEKLVNMVASNVQASAVITGQGGLGKTYTVLDTLAKAGYKDMSDLSDVEVGTRINKSKVFVQIKGYSTAKGLYRSLVENNGSVIVFDDCDAVLKDPVALNLLKGALDSYGKRIISWNADMRDEDLPRSFNFTGRVIFISNLDQSAIDQAIRSRSMMIDLSMTEDQKIDRMAHILESDEFMTEFAMTEKLDALALIRELKNAAKEINLRTLIQVTKIRAAAGAEWKQMAEYVLCN